jgi:ribosomal protein S27E
MKREILCIDCNRETSVIKAKDMRITAEDIEKEGGSILLPPLLPEEIKKVFGSASNVFCCDLCNRIIEKGERCVARSIIGYGQIYKPWEHNYVR